MTRFVLDCSVALSWCLEDESSSYAEQILDALREAEAVVPSIWALEVTNVFLVAERRSRITLAQTAKALKLLKSLPICIDNHPPFGVMESTLSIARIESLSAYDASYLELATREELALATLDKRLAQAARDYGIALY